MTQREAFEEWCKQKYRSLAYLHTSETSGKWDTWQAAQAAQPAHAHAIDTSPERVEKQAGNVQVPEGWKLVPVEPTEEMLYEAQDQHIMPARMKRLWKILLSAAPSTKEQT